jgi:hypothetical protein
MAGLDVFIWAIVGGLFVAALSAAAIYYNNQLPTNKQLSRDFLIGSAFTGFLYPLIPESFDEIKNVITTTASDLNALKPAVLSGYSSGDQDIKIGPANF